MADSIARVHPVRCLEAKHGLESATPQMGLALFSRDVDPWMLVVLYTRDHPSSTLHALCPRHFQTISCICYVSSWLTRSNLTRCSIAHALAEV